MNTQSSFLPRLSLSRGTAPLLPLHHGAPRIRKKPSEYDLDELSPREEDASVLESDLEERTHRISYSNRAPSSVPDHQVDMEDNDRYRAKVLFAGPPPPIATSKLLYKDVEHHGTSFSQSKLNSAMTSTRQTLSSVFFDRPLPSSKLRPSPYDPDSTWRSLQRREKALQGELQHMLDVQAAGLSAGLHGAPQDGSSAGPSSDAGSSTPTGTFYTSRSSRLLPENPNESGRIIPVRQPRSKKMGLRAARNGLTRSMGLLADLKAEEDASLASALSTRKRALVQLRKLAARRDNIAHELQSLEEDDEEPLTRELKDLQEEHRDINVQITEMEERLAGLKNRRRVIEGRLEDVNSQREAGLSGYRNALKEAEAQVTSVLRRPPFNPLDLEALRGSSTNTESTSGREDEAPPGGDEFLRLRPERRTVDMARDWWEAEVRLLEQRKNEVDKDRQALDEGVEVWKEAIDLVMGFEVNLRQQLRAPSHELPVSGKGKQRQLTPEEQMQAQLKDMANVIAGLESHMRTVEDKGWNLLICAIGAELEAFQEAATMLRESLQSAGIDLDEDSTPRLARSAGESGLKGHVDGREEDAGAGGETHEETDNEVPPDLLVDHVASDTEESRAREVHETARDDSENEVPLEFLAEHQD